MQGRYGTDTLSKFLLICGLVVVLFSSFSSSDTVRMIWYVVGWALIIYCYYRMFSRNVTKRYAENQAFLARTYKMRSFFKQQLELMKQRRIYHIYTCPGCRQKIRIPRGKGKIEVRCPKCGVTFVKKIDWFIRLTNRMYISFHVDIITQITKIYLILNFLFSTKKHR